VQCDLRSLGLHWRTLRLNELPEFMGHGNNSTLQNGFSLIEADDEDVLEISFDPEKPLRVWFFFWLFFFGGVCIWGKECHKSVLAATSLTWGESVVVNDQEPNTRPMMSSPSSFTELAAPTKHWRNRRKNEDFCRKLGDEKDLEEVRLEKEIQWTGNLGPKNKFVIHIPYEPLRENWAHLPSYSSFLAEPNCSKLSSLQESTTCKTGQQLKGD